MTFSRTSTLVSEQTVSEVDGQDVLLGSPDTPKRLPFTRILVAVTCGVLVTAVTLTVLLRPAHSPLEPRRTLQRITYDEAALPREAAWAPDGQWVVYAADRAGNADLWKQRLGEPDPVRLTISDANESQPQWSPNGQSIVFRSERDGGGLYVIPASGGVERMVSSFGYEPRWSPDGTLILFKRSAVLPDLPTIYVVGLDGKPPRPVRPDVLGQFNSLFAAWHPDGRRISIWGAIGNSRARFLTVPLESGNVTTPEISAQVQNDLARVSPGRFAWAASRRYIYFEGRADDTQNVWRVTIDPVTDKWVDGPERLTTGAGQETNVAISPDGTRLVFTTTTSRTRLWAFPFDSANGRITGQPHPITQGSTGEVDFDARADGSKVAYRTVRAGRNELWERSIGEGHERLLLSSTDWQFTKPRWSPDGTQLAFSRWATRDHLLAVALLNTDGSGERVLTRSDHVDMQAYDWSRDGQAHPRLLSIQPLRTVLDLPGACVEGGRGRRTDCPRRRVGSQAQSLQPAVFSRSALDYFSRARSVVHLDVHGLRHTDRRRRLAGDHRWRVVRRQAAMGTGRTDPLLRVESDGHHERLGPAIQSIERHADRRAISRYVVQIRTVSVDAAESANGHRGHCHDSASAHDGIAQ